MVYCLLNHAHRWLKYDCKVVAEVGLATVLAQKPYMSFYSMVEEFAAGPVVEAEAGPVALAGPVVEAGPSQRLKVKLKFKQKKGKKDRKEKGDDTNLLFLILTLT